jgi:UDP-N-acetylglucosamine--N-acetylmuramyl-(pentapeptide) pyrophosphoryl-undecaprenol N-acetylglucosamine transferase
MEPNAIPGFTNRRMARFINKALVAFEETAAWFPPGRAEVTGLPVRPEFFALPPKPRTGPLSVLITGGSRGSRSLNAAATSAWPLLRDSNVHLTLQTGAAGYDEFGSEFAAAGGEAVPFIEDMPAAFARADVVVCRSGAGAVAELAASGKPAILVPFPFAADDHQLKNAEALTRAGAARLIRDEELTGERLAQELTELGSDPDALRRMETAVRRFARPHAAQRAADVLEEAFRRA